MLAQTVLPFKLDTTPETLTAQAGLVLFGEYLHAMELPSDLEREFPGPSNPKGYKPSVYGMKAGVDAAGRRAVAGRLADAARRRGIADAVELDSTAE